MFISRGRRTEGLMPYFLYHLRLRSSHRAVDCLRVNILVLLGVLFSRVTSSRQLGFRAKYCSIPGDICFLNKGSSLFTVVTLATGIVSARCFTLFFCFWIVFVRFRNLLLFLLLTFIFVTSLGLARGRRGVLDYVGFCTQEY